MHDDDDDNVEEAEGWGSEEEEDEEDYEDDLEEEAAGSERDLQEAVRKLEVAVSWLTAASRLEKGEALHRRALDAYKGANIAVHCMPRSGAQQARRARLAELHAAIVAAKGRIDEVAQTQTAAARSRERGGLGDLCLLCQGCRSWVRARFDAEAAVLPPAVDATAAPTSISQQEEGGCHGAEVRARTDAMRQQLDQLVADHASSPRAAAAQ